MGNGGKKIVASVSGNNCSFIPVHADLEGIDYRSYNNTCEVTITYKVRRQPDTDDQFMEWFELHPPHKSDFGEASNKIKEREEAKKIGFLQYRAALIVDDYRHELPQMTALQASIVASDWVFRLMEERQEVLCFSPMDALTLWNEKRYSSGYLDRVLEYIEKYTYDSADYALIRLDAELIPAVHIAKNYLV